MPPGRRPSDDMQQRPAGPMPFPHERRMYYDLEEAQEEEQNDMPEQFDQ
jgi:hypothetical protein